MDHNKWDRTSKNSFPGSKENLTPKKCVNHLDVTEHEKKIPIETQFHASNDKYNSHLKKQNKQKIVVIFKTRIHICAFFLIDAEKSERL